MSPVTKSRELNSSHGLGWLALAYVAFVVYGSLVPLDFKPHSLAAALTTFERIRYLDLGAGARADWVANLLLYIPLGFLVIGAATANSRSAIARIVFSIVVLLSCVILAVAIEFTQVFFPPRTVSMNDLIAELIGTVVGITLWHVLGAQFIRIFGTLFAGGAGARRALLVMYLLLYLVLSLFPFDFLVSESELHAKFNSTLVHWFFASGQNSGLTFFQLLKLLAEALSVAPFGVALALIHPNNRANYARAFWSGASLGLLIEGLQLFLVTGISQGISVLTRALGTTTGVALYDSFARRDVRKLAPILRACILLALPLYLMLIGYLGGFFTSPRIGLDLAISRLSEVRWMPFYYHYYTSETTATVSLLVIAILYGAVGLGFWLWTIERRGAPALGLLAGLVAAVTATCTEIGKLFLATKHPDPTNVLIAAVAAFLTYRICRLTFRSKALAATGIQAHPTKPLEPQPITTPRSIKKLRLRTRFAQGLLGLIALVMIYDFPIGRIPLGAFFVIYAILLLRYSWAWMVVVPMALPALDLAHWTGRFFFDEFDILVLVTLAFALANGRLRNSSRSPVSAYGAVMTLVGVSYAASLAISIFPLQPIDVNSFSNYYSHYSGLRIVKGIVSALLLLRLFKFDPTSMKLKHEAIAWGMSLGLALTVAFVLWERQVFIGLFNFQDDYRVTGIFSAMHTGGAYIEAYLVAVTPFAVYLVLTQRSLLLRLPALAIFFGAAYALMVTYSRGGHLAFIVSGCILLSGFVLGSSRLTDAVRRMLIASVIAGIALVVIVPILAGSYAQGRMAKINEDFATRRAHWADARRMMDSSGLAAAFGMGLGRYPEIYFWRNQENTVPATYQISQEGTNAFLRLGAGDSLYFEQLVDVQSGTRYELSFDARLVQGAGGITIPLCEKWMLYSFNCLWNTYRLKPDVPGWQHISTVLDTSTIGVGRWYQKRSVKLTLFNGTAKSVIDVDNVHLVNAAGIDLIGNGDFSSGMDQWFFATDNHLPWHVKNLWVHLFFEQGVLGVVAVGGLLLLALGKLTRRAMSGDLFATAMLSGLSGLLVVGIVDSLVDVPRHALLLYFLAGLSFFLIEKPTRLTQIRHRPSTTTSTLRQ